MSPASIALHNRNEVYTLSLIGITLNFSRKVLVESYHFFATCMMNLMIISKVISVTLLSQNICLKAKVELKKTLFEGN